MYNHVFAQISNFLFCLVIVLSFIQHVFDSVNKTLSRLQGFILVNRESNAQHCIVKHPGLLSEYSSVSNINIKKMNSHFVHSGQADPTIYKQLSD